MRAFAFVFAFFCAFVSSALAEERITSFVSDVTVNADASLTVRETITVQAEGYEIKRGILRDFPTVYRDRMGQRVVVGFEVLDVERDGRDEPFAIESISNGKRIRIGDKDVLLDFGQHSYQITYRTTRQLGFFEDFDELYWNVTGNGWTFAIDQARVIIRLPQGASIQQSSLTQVPGRKRTRCAGAECERQPVRGRDHGASCPVRGLHRRGRMAEGPRHTALRFRRIRVVAC